MYVLSNNIISPQYRRGRWVIRYYTDYLLILFQLNFNNLGINFSLIGNKLQILLKDLIHRTMFRLL